MLLTAPDGSLPPGTRAALQATAVNNVIVLGGPARIPDATLERGSVAHRCGDRADRGARSLRDLRRDGQAARRLVADGRSRRTPPDRWSASPRPEGRARTRSDGPMRSARDRSAVRSTEARRIRGAPVASAAPRGRFGAHARPSRPVPPVTRCRSFSTAPQADRACHPSVVSFLAAVFPTSNWCSSAAVLPSCAMPGFVVALRWSLGALRRCAARRVDVGDRRHLPSHRRPHADGGGRLHDRARHGTRVRRRRQPGGRRCGSATSAARCSVCGGSRCTATARRRSSTASSTSRPQVATSATRTACRAHPERARPCAFRSSAARNGSRSWEASASRVARRRGPHCRTGRCNA